MTNMTIDSTSYTNKDFRTIFPELLELTKSLTNLWDPVNSNESDPGVVLLKLQAFIADKLNYNIDKNILETFPSSVTQRGNAQKLYDLLGYNMKLYESATTEVTFKYIRGTNSKDLPLDSYVIPKYTQLKDDKGSIVYTLLNNATVYINNNSVGQADTLTAIEGTYHIYTINGSELITINNLDSNNRLYFNESQIASNGIFIHNYNDDELWQQVDNLDNTQGGQKVYKFGVTTNLNTCYIEFPEDAASLFSEGIQLSYIISSGIAGNIGAKVLSQLFGELNITSGDQTFDVSKYTKVSNPASATNGKDPESLSDAYANYKKTIGTFNTLVTLRDYENAIFNEGAVSNCVVSDRTNDLNNSYKIRTRTVGGSDLKSITKTESRPVTVVRDGVNELQIRDHVVMDAYNIAVYALRKIPSIYDDKTYNQSFTTNYSAQSDAQESIKTYKSIQHDWIDTIQDGTLFPFLLKNLVRLDGKVLTHQKISSVEADEIQKNINLKLYQTYYSRNISFGEELSYDSLIQTIRNADTRIKEVILSDPDINTYIMDSNNLLYGLNLDTQSDTDVAKFKTELIAKSILAGVTPWCIFDDTAQLAYSLKPCKSYVNFDKYEDVPTKFISGTTLAYDSTKNTAEENYLNTNLNANDSTIEHVTAITTQVNIPLNNNGYTLRENEQVFFYSPSYITTTELSTYLYVYLQTAANEVDILADGIYQLRSNDHLYVSENATDLLTLVSPGNENKSYTARTWDFYSTELNPIFIKPNFNLQSNKPLTKNTVESFNLESINTVSIMEVNKSIINESIVNNIPIKKDMYAVWILNNLNNQLFTQWNSDDNGYVTSEYILQNNEFFIYTDSSKSDIVLLQSGTKLIAKALATTSPQNFNNKWCCPIVSLDDVQKNGIAADFDWQPINQSITFMVQEMQVESLGAGVTLFYNAPEAELKKELILNNIPQVITHASAITWQVDGATYTLPVIDATDNNSSWEGFSRLSCVTTPGYPFTLAPYTKGSVTEGSQQLICFFTSTQTYNESIGDYELAYTPKALLQGGQSFVTNQITVLTGGIQQSTAVLQDDQTFTDDLTVSIYAFKDPTTNRIFKDSYNCSISESYSSDSYKLTIKPESTTTQANFNIELSSLFTSTIIPVAFSSQNSDYQISINLNKITDYDLDIDDNTQTISLNLIPSITVGSTLPCDNLIYYLYVPDIASLNYTLSFTVKLRESSDSQDVINSSLDDIFINLYSPVKISKISDLLKTCYKTESNTDVTIFSIMNDLATQKLNTNDSDNQKVNQFDYTYKVQEDDLISDPTDPNSFYNTNHIYHKYIISQLDTKNLNIKVAKQSRA